MTTLILGIDTSKAKLDAAIKLSGDHQTPIDLGVFSNDPKGFNSLLKEISKHNKPEIPILLVIEPSGGYEQPFAHFALKQEWRVSMPNPHYVRQWAKGTGIRAKTDRVDARVLANYGANQPLLEWKPLPERLRYLEGLLKRQEDLKEALNREKNRLHALEAQEVKSSAEAESIKRTIQWFSEEVQRLEKGLKRFFKDHADLREQAKKLRSIPGVGIRNSMFLLVLLHRWDLLTDGRGHHKGLVAYTGLDPVPCESGTSVYKRRGISRQGNPALRALLYMGAMGNIRCDNPLSSFYKRLVGRGKKKKVALVAAARKILVWAWAIFRSNGVFDPKRAASRSS